MPRPPRDATGDIVYHVLNRANARTRIFHEPGDFKAFEKALEEAHEHVRMRTVAYCVMPNHWHLVLWPLRDGDLSKFMQWLTLTHAQRWHAHYGTVGHGHLYQGRFRSFPVQDDAHFLTVCRYVERNALRAGLVERAEDWLWSSLWRRQSSDPKARALLSGGPLDWPEDWVMAVNVPQTDAELDALRASVRRGRPFGSPTWVEAMACRLGIESTLKPIGRPCKQ